MNVFEATNKDLFDSATKSLMSSFDEFEVLMEKVAEAQARSTLGPMGLSWRVHVPLLSRYVDALTK